MDVEDLLRAPEERCRMERFHHLALLQTVRLSCYDTSFAVLLWSLCEDR